MLIAPIDSTQYARSVREDTAELASFALSDKASIRSLSPPPRQRQTNLESYFTHGQEEDAALSRDGEGLHRHTIPEVSEPVSPESGASSAASSKSHGTSVLTNMLRRSPPSTSPPENYDEDGSHTPHDGAEGLENGRLIITSNGLKMDTTERTPLLTKTTSYDLRHHPDYIGGEQDIEGQEIRRKVSWPKLRNVISWPKRRGMDVAMKIANPKSWDRNAIWQYTVAEPVGYLPAVVLGLLLNILDALSYGTFNPRRHLSIISRVCNKYPYEDYSSYWSQLLYKLLLTHLLFRYDSLPTRTAHLREARCRRYFYVLRELHSIAIDIFSWG
jgi:SulP family sulfate permease